MGGGAWGSGSAGWGERLSWMAYLRRGRQPGDLLRSDGTLPPLSSFSIASLWPHEVGICDAFGAFAWGGVGGGEESGGTTISSDLILCPGVGRQHRGTV